MAELRSLMNIGSEMEKKLTTVGITTAEELKAVGSKEAFMKLRALHPRVCLVHLYTLEGAVSDLPYNQLPEDVKQILKDYVDSFKYGHDSSTI